MAKVHKERYPISGRIRKIICEIQGFRGFLTHFFPVFQGFYHKFRRFSGFFMLFPNNFCALLVYKWSSIKWNYSILRQGASANSTLSIKYHTPSSKTLLFFIPFGAKRGIKKGYQKLESVALFVRGIYVGYFIKIY